MGLLCLKVIATASFETSRTTHPVTQHHIPEDSRPHPHCCGERKSRKSRSRRSQWPRDLSPRSTAARLLRSWVRIPPGAWMAVRCECCVLSGRGLYDELTTRPEESYRLWCVVVCDIQTSSMRSQTSINCDWTYEMSYLAGSSSRYSVYKLHSQPASTSAYKILCNLIADSK